MTDSTQDFYAISKSIHEHATREKAIQTIGEYALALQVSAAMLAEKDAAIAEFKYEREHLWNENERQLVALTDFRARMKSMAEANKENGGHVYLFCLGCLDDCEREASNSRPAPEVER
jgi:hypothetical protein